MVCPCEGMALETSLAAAALLPLPCPALQGAQSSPAALSAALVIVPSSPVCVTGVWALQGIPSECPNSPRASACAAGIAVEIQPLGDLTLFTCRKSPLSHP